MLMQRLITPLLSKKYVISDNYKKKAGKFDFSLQIINECGDSFIMNINLITGDSNDSSDRNPTPNYMFFQKYSFRVGLIWFCTKQCLVTYYNFSPCLASIFPKLIFKNILHKIILRVNSKILSIF